MDIEHLPLETQLFIEHHMRCFASNFESMEPKALAQWYVDNRHDVCFEYILRRAVQLVGAPAFDVKLNKGLAHLEQ